MQYTYKWASECYKYINVKRRRSKMFRVFFFLWRRTSWVMTATYIIFIAVKGRPMSFRLYKTILRPDENCTFKGKIYIRHVIRRVESLFWNYALTSVIVVLRYRQNNAYINTVWKFNRKRIWPLSFNPGELCTPPMRVFLIQIIYV